MPKYIWKCMSCSARQEIEESISKPHLPPESCECGETKPDHFCRDYGRENVVTTYHPTNDLYVRKKRGL